MQPQERQQLARVYLAQPRDQALKDHPSLRSAYAVEDALRKIAAEARPLTPAVGETVDNMIRQTVAQHIAKGVEPTVSPQAQANLRFQVASRSLEHALGERLLHPDSALNISREHRELLVQHAQAQIGARPGREDAGDALDSGTLRAQEIAGNLASLDYPKASNPFSEKSLAERYARQQQLLKDGQERGGRPDKGRGER